MKRKRDKVYIWVTWLTKLISGEQQCEYQSWFKAHFKHDKKPSDFNLVKWNIKHNQLLHKRRAELEKKGYAVHTENQNSFYLNIPKGSFIWGAKEGIAFTISGKADLVALNILASSMQRQALVEDCKTGKAKNSDQVQVMLYMMFLPKCIEEYKDTVFNGHVIYTDDKVPIFSTDIDEFLKEVVWDLVVRIASDEPCRKVSSCDECKYCDILKKDCPERVE